MNTVSLVHRPLAVTVAHAPMVRASDYSLPYGRQTLADVVADAIARGAAPERFWWHGRLTIEGMPINAEHWTRVRPKPGTHLHLWIPPMDPVTLSGIGLALFSAGAPVALASAVLTLPGTLLTIGLGIVGQLAINALFAPPATALSNESADIAQANSAGIRQNIPRQGQPYPFVFGTARVAPQPLCHVRTYLSGDNEYAETVLALAGPHSMSDIRIDDVPVDEDTDIETWIDDGTAELRTNQFVGYAGPTVAINRELPRQDVRIDEDGFTDLALRDQATPANSLPGWLRCKSLRNADYVDLRLTIRNPYDASAGAVNQVIWFRLRARAVGETTWKNIATLPYIGKGQGDYRRRIRFHFARYVSATDNPKGTNGFILPAATLPAVTDDHAVIKNSDGNRFPPAYTFEHIRQPEGIDIYPDDDDSETYFTTGEEFEFDLQRSEMVEESELSGGNVATMYDGSKYWDYFDARNIGSGIWGIYEDTTDQGDQVYLESAISMFEGDIVPQAATVSTLHVRVKNKTLSSITVLASSLVPNWNGTIWTGQAASASPADQMRHVWTGGRTVAPISTAHVDDETLGDWADECTAQSRTVNMAFYGGTVGEALGLIAACGYARQIEGLKYSVAYYHDTSEERAVQAFTPRNIRNYSWSASFSPRPGSILAKFLNADNDYESDELIVEDPYAVPGATGEIEEIEFPGFTTAAQVTARAQFDFLQLRRNIRHTFEVGFEWLSSETRPGKVAMLSHDALHSQAAWGRVASITDGSSFVVDADIGYAASTDFLSLSDLFDSEDVFSQGEDWGVAIRRADDGDVIVVPLESWTEATRTVGIPDTTNISEGDMCIFGPLIRAIRRVLLLNVEPNGDDGATITCQDEGYEWPLGYGSPEGALLDGLYLELDGMALNFLTGKALIRDRTTPANAFHGNINDLLTYTSPSTKYILNADGVLEAGTTLRIDYDFDGNALGLLCEPQRTNVVLHNRDLTNAAWTAANATVAKDQTGIDGVANAASSMTATSNFGTCKQAITLASSARFQSAYVKRLAGSGAVQMTTDNGSTWTDVTVTASWSRVSIPTQTLANPTVGFRLAVSGDSIAVDFVQNENGAYATSPIPTTTVSVTRNADNISLATSDFPFSATAGSITVEAAPAYVPAAFPGRLWAISDGTVNERIIGIAGSIQHFFVGVGGVGVVNLDAGTFVAETASKLACAWQENDFAVSLDGSAVATDGSGAVPTVDTLYLGVDYDGMSNHLGGHLKSLTYRPRRITNAELIAETD